MSLQLTRKEIKQNWFCIGVPYCDLQHLLSYFNKLGYYAGVYGWRGDVYVFDSIALCTGYETIQTIAIDDKKKRQILKKYNEKASHYIERFNYDYKKIHNQARKDMERLLRDIKANTKL